MRNQNSAAVLLFALLASQPKTVPMTPPRIIENPYPRIPVELKPLPPEVLHPPIPDEVVLVKPREMPEVHPLTIGYPAVESLA